MKTKIFFILLASILIAAILPGGSAFAIDPIVSTDLLDDYKDDVVIIDIRPKDVYDEAHIPGSINEPFVVPFSAWITMRDDLLLEVPETADLFIAIGNLGITGDSWVVIVTDPNPGEPPFYGLSAATRVADTLIYAGVVNVAILDGGYTKWVADGGEPTTDVPDVTSVPYDGDVNEAMFVSANYVRRHLWRADIIDARDADVYYGATIEPFAPKAGHIRGAASLPAPWIWDLNEDGTYTFKDLETLGAMASGVIHEPWYYCAHWSPKIIVYCGVGGYASSWWFVLTQVLGYENVKFYDGSAQEWVRYYDMVPYQWD